MNSSSIFNIKRKKTLNLLMSYLPKMRKLEIVQKNKRLQKALKIKEVLYEIYSLKNSNQSASYSLQDFGTDEYTKREILNSLFEISNLPFFNGIGFTLKGHTKRISLITKLPPIKEDDNKIASCSWDCTIKIWDMNTQDLDVSLPPVKEDDIICSLIPLYNETTLQNKKNPIYLMAVTWDKNIYFYNLANNKIEHTKTIEQFGKLICAIKSRNFLLTSSYESAIRVWSIPNYLHNDNKLENIFKKKDEKEEEFNCLATLNGHTDAVPKMIELSNGKIASLSWDKTVRIWNLDTFNCDLILDQSQEKLVDMIQLKDGRIATHSLSGKIRIINLIKKECDYQFEGNYFLYQLDDGRLVTGIEDSTFQIFNLETKKKELHFKTAHKDSISCFIQLEDGRIITSSFDKTIRVYGFVTKRELINEAYDYDFHYENGCLYITHE